jgi:uroporphyrinogen-III synthase
MPEPSHAALQGGYPRVVVTRRAEQAPLFCDKLRAAGFTPLCFPTIQLESLPALALDAALAKIETFDWLLFSSGNAVDFFFRRLFELNLEPRLPRTAVVGSATAHKLAEYHIHPDFMPCTFSGEALAAGLGDLTGQQILLPRARLGRPQIVAKLLRQGASVTEISLYDTVTAVPVPGALDQLAAGFDAITFTSPSSVRGFLQISGTRPGESAVVACVGPVTAQTAVENDLTVTLMPDEYTLDGLVQVLAQHFARQPL